jgi:site-specific DNA-methyltransferase (adenine-specific)
MDPLTMDPLTMDPLTMDPLTMDPLTMDPLTMDPIQLSENVQLYIQDANTHVSEQLYTMIYFDPPFNSKRNYTLNVNSSVGFTDKWMDDEYFNFIKTMIDKLHDMLEKKGTLFFHISSSCMFIPELILRQKFKFVEPIFWKKCRSKNNVKNKLGSTVDIIWKCNKVAKPKFNIVLQEKDPTYLKNSFKNKDDVGNYALGHLVTEKTKKGYMYSVEIADKTFNPKSGWRIKKSELEMLISENRIHMPKKAGANLYKNERLIKISTDEGDYVLDPMCGSGTTGGACEKLNRKCTLIDKNTDVVDIVQSRFN